ncbi:hypothetical protein [Pediococcus acidilactici]|nr:hypothetical protein [Pediococcus acidilactici]
MKNDPTVKPALSLSGVNEVITNINELAIIQTIYNLLVLFANCNSKLASADKAHRRKGSWEFQVDQD